MPRKMGHPLSQMRGIWKTDPYINYNSAIPKKAAKETNEK
jgi:hypothetical protein